MTRSDRRAAACLVTAMTSGAGCQLLAGIGPREVAADAAVDQGVAATMTLGISSIESTHDSNDANQVIATSATLSRGGTVASISLYVDSGGAVGDVMLAIYDATGADGAPGALWAQTASFALVSGWNTQPVTAAVTLHPGSYYLAFLPSSNSAGPVFTSDTPSSNYFLQLGSYGVLPTMFGSGKSQPGIAYSEYATLTASSSDD